MYSVNSNIVFSWIHHVLLEKEISSLRLLSCIQDIIFWVNFRHVAFLFQVITLHFQMKENYKRMSFQMMTMLRQHLCLNRFFVASFIILYHPLSSFISFSMISADNVAIFKIYFIQLVYYSKLFITGNEASVIKFVWFKIYLWDNLSIQGS